MNLLRYVICQPAEQVLISVAQKYTWREIWNDEQVGIELQNALRDAPPGASRARTDGRESFSNFQVTVMKLGPVDEGLKIAGYPSAEDYLKAKAIEKGQNPYQSTHVVPQAGRIALGTLDDTPSSAAILGLPSLFCRRFW